MMIDKVVLKLAEGASVNPGDIFVKGDVAFKVLDILQVHSSVNGVVIDAMVTPFPYASFEMIEYYREKSGLELVGYLDGESSAF